jgi:integrase
MPRPNRDGTRAQAPNKRKLSALFINKIQPRDRTFLIWDSHQRGLALSVLPSGNKSWKCIYRRNGRPRWYHIGSADALGPEDARKLANRVMFAVAEGKDPAAERKAERSRGTFEDLAAQYVEQHAKRKNKSWKQADALVRKHLLPRWAKLQAGDISRREVKAMMARIEAPIVANQTLAAASAIFAWAMREEITKVNPCALVDRNPTNERERVLSDSEIPKFWAAFGDAGLVRGAALKTILLTGQRPGEVAHMRLEHIVDGWWQMPGEPVHSLGWPGTKNGNSHRVWLPAPAAKLIKELTDGADGGFVFANARGGPIDKLDDALRDICSKLGVAHKATPHDLRRTHGTTITALGFGRDAMNRIQNHKRAASARFTIVIRMPTKISASCKLWPRTSSPWLRAAQSPTWLLRNFANKTLNVLHCQRRQGVHIRYRCPGLGRAGNTHLGLEP